MIENYFTPEAAKFIREAITEAYGNEVFFVGKVDETSLVCDVKVLARGNRQAVPAILDSAKTGNVVVHNHPSGNLEPSPQDVAVASAFGNKGVGFYIVDSEVEKVYVVVEPFVPGETVRVDDESAREYLLPAGPVSRVLGEKYEHRDEQLEVLSSVIDAFNDEHLSMIEAGTGTGKTLSYLIPSILWSISNSERVLVSTNTINLQEQLINKDLPLLRNLFPRKFDYALVKGMRNYFCLLRGEAVGQDLFDFIDDGERGSMKDVLEWAKTTADGSLSDLAFTPPDDVWDKVSAESESCPGTKCPHYSSCFFFKSRRELSRASVLVANHHMLFSDIAIKGTAGPDSDFGIIPRYAKVVFDEAHNIAEAATSHFSLKLSKHGIARTLSKLRSRKNRDKGLVSYISHLAQKEKDSALREVFERSGGGLARAVERIEVVSEEAFNLLYGFGVELSGETAISLRLTEEIVRHEKWRGVEERFGALEKSLFSLEKEIAHLLGVVEGSPHADSHIKLTAELGGIAKRSLAFREAIGRFFGEQDESYIRWFEGNRRRAAIFCSINLSPLDVSKELDEKLYSKTKTVVMTSASLAVDKNFDFQRKNIGLSDNERFRGLIVDSPFDFQTQSLLLVPSDMPEPGREDYEDSLARILSDSISITNGNALVLFTSYSSLNRVYEKTGKILENIEAVPVSLFKQGEMPRGLLLEKFKTLGNSVLFATDSFWEGVDIPGDSLKMVVICRLPFKVPTDPVTEAKIEYMENQDIDSFREYILPHAVLRFKQGFGRLIRTKTDRGVVMVLDRRIVSKYYGKFFINSVSGSDFFCRKTEQILERMRNFFSEKREH